MTVTRLAYAPARNYRDERTRNKRSSMIRHALTSLAAHSICAAAICASPANAGIANAAVPDLGELAPIAERSAGGYSLGAHELDTDHSLTITSGNGSQMSVELPAEFTDATFHPQDETRLEGESSSGSVATVESSSDGRLRVTTSIESESSPASFSYIIDANFELSTLDDGSVLAYRFAGNSEAPEIYWIHAPWAIDSNGRPIETHYEITGNKLTQIVATDANASYPVSADPTFEWYTAAYGAGLNKQETKDYANYAAAGALCSFVPGGLQPYCAVGAMAWAIELARAKDRGGCAFLAVAPVPVGLNYDSSANCV